MSGRKSERPGKTQEKEEIKLAKSFSIINIFSISSHKHLIFLYGNMCFMDSYFHGPLRYNFPTVN